MTKTFLPQNEFISGSAVTPNAAKSEAASLIAPHDAVTLSDGVGAKPILAFTPSEAATVSGREPVAATTIQLTPSCDVAGDPSPMHDGGTWEQRRALTNGDSLVLEPTLTGRGACDSATLSHNKITQALEIQSSCGEASDDVTRKQPSMASRLTPPGPQDHIHDLEQLIGVAGKRRRRPLALPRFAPDFPELWKAMHDKTAPRMLAGDPVWADEPPLFLQDERGIA